eukprot:TRINITY_DN1104_c0_g1_i1.p1 TRINITY_DN1104_c0_g1~~TRINITY_DN1104_c0_g1_i1.p1  ORF type:complete len:140 (+),score=20.18 TRINITY_DN1104_c0_g1_i1:220-639(+)
MGDTVTHNVHSIHDAAAFHEKLKEASAAGKVVVIDFTASWCGPCKLMAPYFADLSKQYTQLVFLKVDVDELPDITSKWDVQAMPTFKFIKDNREVDKVVGASKDQLEKKIKTFAEQYKLSHGGGAEAEQSPVASFAPAR